MADLEKRCRQRWLQIRLHRFDQRRDFGYVIRVRDDALFDRRILAVDVDADTRGVKQRIRAWIVRVAQPEQLAVHRGCEVVSLEGLDTLELIVAVCRRDDAVEPGGVIVEGRATVVRHLAVVVVEACIHGRLGVPLVVLGNNARREL